MRSVRFNPLQSSGGPIQATRSALFWGPFSSARTSVLMIDVRIHSCLNCGHFEEPLLKISKKFSINLLTTSQL